MKHWIDRGYPPVPWPYQTWREGSEFQSTACWREYMYSGYSRFRWVATLMALWRVFWYRIHEVAHPGMRALDPTHHCVIERIGGIS